MGKHMASTRYLKSRQCSSSGTCANRTRSIRLVLISLTWVDITQEMYSQYGALKTSNFMMWWHSMKAHHPHLWLEHHFDSRHSELDMEMWALHTHDPTCYKYDKIALLQEIMAEWAEYGLHVYGKFYPGTWSSDWVGYY